MLHARTLVRHKLAVPRRWLNVGAKLPKVPLRRGTPADLAPLEPKGRSLLIGVPAAFSPSCSAKHIPGFVSAWTDLQRKGVSTVNVVAVNDVFVVKAWQETFDLPKGWKFYSDDGAWTRAAELDFDASKVLGGLRCKRFVAVLEDDKVVQLHVEPDGTGMTVSTAEAVLQAL